MIPGITASMRMGASAALLAPTNPAGKNTSFNKATTIRRVRPIRRIPFTP